MAIQGAINSMLGTAAGAMTAVVAKAKMLDDKTVSDQANTRAMQVAEERRRKRQLYGVNVRKAAEGGNETKEAFVETSHNIMESNPEASKFSKEDKHATAMMNLGRTK